MMWVCLALFAGVLALYGPVAKYDFVSFDDPLYVLNNPNINHGISWRGFLWCFHAGYAANWHPVTWISHMVDCQVFGASPTGPHLINVLLHAANAVLLFLLLQNLTRAFWRSALVAALFALHPLRVESVAWIAERKDVLCGLFWLSTMWAYAGYTRKKNAECQKLGLTPKPKGSVLTFDTSAQYLLTLFLFALALMSKPMAVTLPFVLLLMDYWPLRRREGMTLSKLIFEKIPFLVLSVGSCWLTLMAQQRGGAVSSLSRVPLHERLTVSYIDYFRYVEKTFWPARLSVMYPLMPGWPAWELIAAAVFLISGFAAALILWRRAAHFSFGWFWYLGTLIPVIGLIQVGSQSMADRYTYIPSIGLFVLFCWGAFDLAQRLRVPAAVDALAAIAVVVACWLVTERQITYWKNAGTLFSHAIAVTERNYVAHTYYGAYLRDQNQLEAAVKESQEALAIAPNYSMGHVFLGGIYQREHRIPDAVAELQTAIKYDPDLFVAYANLGDMYLTENNFAGAAAAYRKATELEPDNYRLHCSLGRMLEVLKHPADAQNELETSLRLNPDFTDAHYELAVLLTQEHQIPAAIAQYQVALREQPNFSDALNNLAWIRAASADAQYRNGTEAVQMAEKSCQLVNNSQPFKLGTLAAAYAEAGRFDDAAAAAQKAHDLALNAGETNVAARNLELQKLYRAHQPYHEAALSP